MFLLFPSPCRVSKENGVKRETEEKRYLRLPQLVTAVFHGKEEEGAWDCLLCACCGYSCVCVHTGARVCVCRKSVCAALRAYVVGKVQCRWGINFPA